MLNKCMFIGNLGADPEIRNTAGGQTVCSLNLAVNEKRKQGDKWVDHTEWVKVTVWGATATACGNHLKKGKQVYVEGRMTTRKWQDKNGQDRWTTEINADQVQFLGGAPSKDENRDDRRPQGGNDANSGHSNSDDIPY